MLSQRYLNNDREVNPRNTRTTRILCKFYWFRVMISIALKSRIQLLQETWNTVTARNAAISFLHPISYFCTLYSILFSLYSFLYTLYSMLFSLYSFLYALFSILYTLCSILYILFPQIPTSMKNNDPPCNGTCEICDCLKSPPTLNPKPTIHNS